LFGSDIDVKQTSPCSIKSAAQDVLYRDMKIVGHGRITRVIQTLAQSTHLAELWTDIFRNLRLDYITGCLSFLSRCTFKLASFSCRYFYFKPLHRFLICQPSLMDVELGIPPGTLPRAVAVVPHPYQYLCIRISWGECPEDEIRVSEDVVVDSGSTNQR
jgi:hypothetical protein